MSTELRSLRNLVALAKRLSYSRAADDRGISQPALTRSIQALERDLGMRLFDRDRAGVSVTPHGRLVIERAASLIAEADDFDRQARLTATGKGGQIRFGMAPLSARALLPGCLTEQLQTSSELANDVVIRNVSALWPLLIANEIEFFVSAEGQVPDNPPVRSETLGYFPVSLIVRTGHPLLEGQETGATYPILLSSRAGLSGEVPDDIRHLASGTTHVIEDVATLSALVQQSDAIWVSSIYAAMQEIEAGTVSELPLAKGRQPQQFRMVLYSLERRTQSPAAIALKEAFHRQMKDLTTFRQTKVGDS